MMKLRFCGFMLEIVAECNDEGKSAYFERVKLNDLNLRVEFKHNPRQEAVITLWLSEGVLHVDGFIRVSTEPSSILPFKNQRVGLQCTWKFKTPEILSEITILIEFTKLVHTKNGFERFHLDLHSGMFRHSDFGSFLNPLWFQVQHQKNLLTSLYASEEGKDVALVLLDYRASLLKRLNNENLTMDSPSIKVHSFFLETFSSILADHVGYLRWFNSFIPHDMMFYPFYDAENVSIKGLESFVKCLYLVDCEEYKTYEREVLYLARKYDVNPTPTPTFFSLLYTNDNAKDVSLVLDQYDENAREVTPFGDSVVKVHKSILEATSQLSARINSISFGNPPNIVPCIVFNHEDVTLEGLRAFVKFLYGVLEDDEILEHRYELVRLANSSGVNSLYKTCLRALTIDLCSENVCQRLIFADTYNVDPLKWSCFDYLASFSKVVDLDTFEPFNATIPENLQIEFKEFVSRESED